MAKLAWIACDPNARNQRAVNRKGIPKLNTNREPCRPDKSEYFEYYDTYVQQVQDGSLLDFAISQVEELRTYFGNVRDDEAAIVHAPYTWTIKQVVGHLIDTERIFANRLHRFSCGDFQPESGMDQDTYVANCDYVTPTLAELVEEWMHLRLANVGMMRRTKASAWDHVGVASDHKVTVRALAYMLVGHVTYHMKIIRSRLG